MKIEMGAKSWRNPEVEKKWIESEKKRIADEAEQKIRDEEQKLLEEEQAKLVREEMLATGRSQAMETAEARLAQLRAEVAALEGKQNGTWKSAEELEELDRRERAARELEDRSKRLEAEAEAKAAAIVAMKEKELEDKRKAHEAEQNELAVKRRRQLLEYKHYLGLLSPKVRAKYGDRPPGFHRRQGPPAAQAGHGGDPGDPTLIYNDPAFWELPEDQQAYLESLTAEEQAAEGFGPYAFGDEPKEEDLYAELPDDDLAAWNRARAADEAALGAHASGHQKPAGLFGHPTGGRNGLFGPQTGAKLGTKKDLGDVLGGLGGAPKYDPARMANFICVTTDSVPGHHIVHIIQDLVGTVIRDVPRGDSRDGSTHIRLLQRNLELDRQGARGDLIRKAMNLSANAVVGLRFDSSAPVAICAYGTAVILERDALSAKFPGQQQNPPVTNEQWMKKAQPTFFPGAHPAIPPFAPFQGVDPREVEHWRQTDPRAFDEYVRMQRELYLRRYPPVQPPWVRPHVQPPWAQPLPPRAAWGATPSRFGAVPAWNAPPPPKAPEDEWKNYAAQFAKKKAAEMQAARGAGGGEKSRGGGGEQVAGEKEEPVQKPGGKKGKNDAAAAGGGNGAAASVPKGGKQQPQNDGGGGKKGGAKPTEGQDDTKLHGNTFSFGDETKSPLTFVPRKQPVERDPPAPQPRDDGAFNINAFADALKNANVPLDPYSTLDGRYLPRERYDGEVPFGFDEVYDDRVRADPGFQQFPRGAW